MDPSLNHLRDEWHHLQPGPWDTCSHRLGWLNYTVGREDPGDLHYYTPFSEITVRGYCKRHLLASFSTLLQVIFQLDLFPAKISKNSFISREKGMTWSPQKRQIILLTKHSGICPALDVCQGSCWLWQRGLWLRTCEAEILSIDSSNSTQPTWPTCI